MGVLGLANLRPKPGSFVEAVGDAIKVGRIVREISPNTTLWRTIQGGEDTYRLTLTTELASFGDHLDFDQAFYAHPDVQALLGTYVERTFPYLSASANSVMMTLPGRQQPILGPSGSRELRAAVTALYAYPPAVLAWLEKVADLGGAHGFTSYQYASVAAGARPPVVLVSQVFPDRRAMGVGLDAMIGNADLLAGLQDIGASLLGRWLMEELPL